MQEEAAARARWLTRTMKDATQDYAGHHPDEAKARLRGGDGLVLRDIAILTLLGSE